MGCIQVDFWYSGIYHGVLCCHHGFHDFLIWGHIILAEQQWQAYFDLLFRFISFVLFLIIFFILGFWRFLIPAHGDTGVIWYFVVHSFFPCYGFLCPFSSIASASQVSVRVILFVQGFFITFPLLNESKEPLGMATFFVFFSHFFTVHQKPETK